MRFVKLAAIFVPLGISLAAAGAIMYYASTKPASAATASNIVSEVRHPVSQEMLLAAAAMSQKTAPFFKVKDAHDKEVQIGGTGKKPQFVYFILSGCPCSFDAQPLFNNLYKRFKDKVDFIGVISSGKDKAIDFAGQTMTFGPIVCDEKQAIIKAFGAKQSTYNLVVRPDGTIAKAWPGYWKDQLNELNAMLAKLTGEPEVPFDAQYAPVKKTSGCYF
jgi:peroxiredoxin